VERHFLLSNWQRSSVRYACQGQPIVTMQQILSAHESATLERIKSQPVVLLVNDTTQLNYVVERKKESIGTIRPQERTRYHLHPTIAVTPDRVCLGAVTGKFWQRPEETEGYLGKQEAVEEKENIRWLESYEHACEISRETPQSLIVSVGEVIGKAIFMNITTFTRSEMMGKGHNGWFAPHGIGV